MSKISKIIRITLFFTIGVFIGTDFFSDATGVDNTRNYHDYLLLAVLTILTIFTSPTLGIKRAWPLTILCLGMAPPFFHTSDSVSSFFMDGSVAILILGIIWNAEHHPVEKILNLMGHVKENVSQIAATSPTTQIDELFDEMTTRFMTMMVGLMHNNRTREVEREEAYIDHGKHLFLLGVAAGKERGLTKEEKTEYLATYEPARTIADAIRILLATRDTIPQDKMENKLLHAFSDDIGNTFPDLFGNWKEEASGTAEYLENLVVDKKAEAEKTASAEVNMLKALEQTGFPPDRAKAILEAYLHPLDRPNPDEKAEPPTEPENL